MHLSSLDRDVSRPPGRNRSGITAHDRICTQTLAQLMSHHLRLHGLFLARGSLEHRRVPLAHALLRVSEKPAIVLSPQQWYQSRERLGAVTDQSDFDGITESDTDRVDVYLYGARAARLRQKLHVRKRAADHQQRVALFHRVLRRTGADQPDAPGRIWTVIGDARLAEQRLDDGRGEQLSGPLELGGRSESAGARQNGNFAPAVENFRCASQSVRSRHRGGRSEMRGAMLGNIVFRALTARERLDVCRNGDVRHGPVTQCGTARELGDGGDMLGAHNPRVISRHVDEQLVQFHVLLGMRAKQVVMMQPGNGKDRCAIELGIIETVEQMNAARTGSGEAYAEPAGKLGIGARHERCTLFVATLHEPDLFLSNPESLHDAVYAVAGEAENRIDAPIE